MEEFKIFGCLESRVSNVSRFSSAFPTLDEDVSHLYRAFCMFSKFQGFQEFCVFHVCTFFLLNGVFRYVFISFYRPGF